MSQRARPRCAVRLEDEHVGQVRERRAVRDDPRKSDLPARLPS